jgi:predicted outer membrane repeat protein
MRVVKNIIWVFLLFSCVYGADAQIIYVRSGASGDGSSWEKALGSLQHALKMASPGYQIWVAQGTYTPTQNTDRTVSFVIPDGVALFGGFSGTETDLNQRDWNQYPTILSGEIGYPDPDDNSFSVIYTKGVSRSTQVDGFMITAGRADGKGAYAGPNRCGGGWFNDGSNGESSPTIRNCLFRKNFARDGGAIYNKSTNGVTRPLIQHCQFVSNKSLLDGGAMTNDGSWGESRPEILNSEFVGNEAVYGACLVNRAQEGSAVPVLTNCLLASNISYISGSGIYNAEKTNGICNSVLNACRFEGNQASVSGEVSGSGTPSSRTRSSDQNEENTGLLIRSSRY